MMWQAQIRVKLNEVHELQFLCNPVLTFLSLQGEETRTRYEVLLPMLA